MRISDWSSDVCSSDLAVRTAERVVVLRQAHERFGRVRRAVERGFGHGLVHRLEERDVLRGPERRGVAVEARQFLVDRTTRFQHAAGRIDMVGPRLAGGGAGGELAAGGGGTTWGGGGAVAVGGGAGGGLAGE